KAFSVSVNACRMVVKFVSDVAAFSPCKNAWWSVRDEVRTVKALAVSAKPLPLSTSADRAACFLAKALWWDVLDSNQ
ncbi:MAG: hypothetical protein AAF367_12405, partial [Pseudomonadota bacterium]